MSATRVPRRPSDGKPLPAPPPLPEEWQDEPTVKERWSPEELDRELAQHAEYGQGDAGDDDRTFHRRVL
jgi:hypothetical protein